MDPSLSDSPKLQVPSEAPYTLVQIDAAAPVQVTPLALSWHNLSVVDSTPIKKTTSVKQLPTDEPRGPKLLLDNISGEAVPGELLAIVGPSSSALTLLLATISGRSASTMSGTLQVNQQNVGLMTPTMVAEVARENKLYPALTVEEHLRYQAELQLGGNTTREDQAERVADVLAETGLTEVRGSLVGDGSDDDKGITARDRKLLALAIDLISNPSILLLEEPLAGLRAFDIEIVVSRLQSLARNGHTVIMTSTFDQLPSAVFGVVDKLHLLTSVGDDARASTVFHGKPADSITYFQAQGHPCPPLTNPFEFFAHLLSGTDAKAESRIQHLASSWGSAGRRYTADLPPLFAGADTAVLGSTESVVTRSNSILLQYGVLFRRNFTHLIHSIPSMRGRIIQALGTALFIGLIFIRLDISQLHTSSFSSACYLVATTQFSSHCLPEVSSTPNEVALVLRDHRNRLYHALRWYIVKNFVELPLQMIFPMVFLVPVYFLIGFPADFGVFIKFYFFLFLVASCGTAAGYFASCIAKKPKTAMMIGMAMIIPASLFGGAFVNRKTTPVYLLWLQQSSPVKYGYHGLMRAFWEHINTIPCPPGGICRASTGRGVLALNLVHPDKFTSDWHILVIINLSLRLAGALALARRAYAMRK